MAWSLHVYGEVSDTATAQRIAEHLAAVLEGLSRNPAITVDSATFDARGTGSLDLLNR